jgi:hypothetical protein
MVMQIPTRVFQLRVDHFLASDFLTDTAQMPTSGLFDFFSLDLMPVMPWSIVNLKEIIPPIAQS